MFRRQSKKEKNLWSEYPKYTPINNVEEKPLFDETRVSDEHRVLGQIIRENWQLIHPLARDYLLSSATEWRNLLTEIGMAQSNLESKQRNIQSIQYDYDKKTQNILLEKEAKLERIKEEIAESYKEIIEQKDQELTHYKMLAESASESSISKSNLESELLAKDKQIADLEKVIQEIESKRRTQEEEAMSVQTGIAKNFQQQINEITNDLYEKQEQIDRLRDVLTKAKEQLISLKEKNENLGLSDHELKTRIDTLERMLAEKDDKLRKVVKTIKDYD